MSGAESYVLLAMQQHNTLRMLAVARDKRHPAFPDVPTVRNSMSASAKQRSASVCSSSVPFTHRFAGKYGRRNSPGLGR